MDEIDIWIRGFEAENHEHSHGSDLGARDACKSRHFERNREVTHAHQPPKTCFKRVVLLIFVINGTPRLAKKTHRVSKDTLCGGPACTRAFTWTKPYLCIFNIDGDLRFMKPWVGTIMLEKKPLRNSRTVMQRVDEYGKHEISRRSTVHMTKRVEKYDRGAPWTKIRFGGTVLEEKIVRKSMEATPEARDTQKHENLRRREVHMRQIREENMTSAHHGRNRDLNPRF